MEHEWWVKRELLPLFNQGKDLEVRVWARHFESVSKGDLITFNESIRRRVKAVRRYASFAVMLENEDSRKILPRATPEKVLTLLTGIYSRHRELLGVFVFELEVED